jgi:hypothetical protein
MVEEKLHISLAFVLLKYPNTLQAHRVLFTDMPIYGNVKIYSSKELKKATRNFCSANKLGQGSFGCVYLVGLVASFILQAWHFKAQTPQPLAQLRL